MPSTSIFDIPVETIAGQSTTLAQYRGQVLLVVNTASECGFTPQFAELQSLYERFRDRGFMVLGFPCNQFGGQEPLDNAGITEFCKVNYGVTFPMFAKIDVNGSDAHPLFVALKKAAPGLLGTEAIKWNFTKFLVGRDGQVVDRFAPNTTPLQLDDKVQAALG